jgi:hypothetical protein
LPQRGGTSGASSGYGGMRDEPKKPQDAPKGEIDPITCIVFVLIVFLIVPFTMLSPFRYPAPSALDKLLAVNVQHPSTPAISNAPFFARSASERTAGLPQPVKY